MSWMQATLQKLGLRGGATEVVGELPVRLQTGSYDSTRMRPVAVAGQPLQCPSFGEAVLVFAVQLGAEAEIVDAREGAARPRCADALGHRL